MAHPGLAMCPSQSFSSLDLTSLSPGQVEAAATLLPYRRHWKLPKLFDRSVASAVLHCEEVIKHHNRKRGTSKRYLLVTLRGVFVFDMDGKMRRHLSLQDIDKMYIEETRGCLAVFTSRKSRPLKLQLLRPAGEGLEDIVTSAALLQHNKDIRVRHVPALTLEQKMRMNVAK